MADLNKEQWWYFTFGYGQKHGPKGFAKFYGTYGSARDQMVEQHGDKWSFQYDEKYYNEKVKQWNYEEVK